MSKEDKKWEEIQKMEEAIIQLSNNVQFLHQLIRTLGIKLNYEFESQQEDIGDGKVKVTGQWVEIKKKSGIITL